MLSLRTNRLLRHLGVSVQLMSDYWGKHRALTTSVDKPSRAQVGQFGPTRPCPNPTLPLTYHTIPYHTLLYPCCHTTPLLCLTLPLPYPSPTKPYHYPYPTLLLLYLTPKPTIPYPSLPYLTPTLS